MKSILTILALLLAWPAQAQDFTGWPGGTYRFQFIGDGTGVGNCSGWLKLRIRDDGSCVAQNSSADFNIDGADIGGEVLGCNFDVDQTRNWQKYALVVWSVDVLFNDQTVATFECGAPDCEMHYQEIKNGIAQGKFREASGTWRTATMRGKVFSHWRSGGK